MLIMLFCLVMIGFFVKMFVIVCFFVNLESNVILVILLLSIGVLLNLFVVLIFI